MHNIPTWNTERLRTAVQRWTIITCEWKIPNGFRHYQAKLGGSQSLSNSSCTVVPAKWPVRRHFFNVHLKDCWLECQYFQIWRWYDTLSCDPASDALLNGADTYAAQAIWLSMQRRPTNLIIISVNLVEPQPTHIVYVIGKASRRLL